MSTLLTSYNLDDLGIWDSVTDSIQCVGDSGKKHVKTPAKNP